MTRYDFDKVTDLSDSGAVKYTLLGPNFGRTDLTPLWIADMDFECCPAVADCVRDHLRTPIFGYQAAPDSYWQSIIDWLGKRHGVKVTRDELSFCNGVVKGIAYAVNFFSKPGDNIIIQPPVYHPFSMVIKGNHRTVAENPLHHLPDGSYEMDLEGLETLMAKPQTSMMILCNPHNPAGIKWSEDTLRTVAKMAKKHDVTVISDEIHGDLILWGQKHTPFVDTCPEASEVGIWLGAPSKTFNIPGFMSSWMVVRNPALRKPYYDWLASNEFNDPCYTAVIAAEAAYRNGEEWLNQAIDYIQDNILYVEEYLRQHLPCIKPLRPQASFLVWLDMSALGLSQAKLMQHLVHDAHLALNDGTMFGTGGDGFLRMNVASPRSVITDALDRLHKIFAITRQ